MSQDSLMQRMIAAGVNILNPQEVFEFYHAEGGGNLDIDQLKTQVYRWIADAILGKADLEDLDDKATILQLSYKADRTDLDAKADKAELELKANASDLNIYAEKTAMHAKADQSDLVILDANKADKSAVNQQLSEKLDRSEYQQHYRGLFANVEALEQNVSNPIAGDYANVDAGVDSPTNLYAYDVDDNKWRLQGSSGLTVNSSDSVPEGNTNLYFTAARAESAFRGMNSGILPEGVNLYYTDARVLAVLNPILNPILDQIGEIDQLLTEALGA